MTRDRSKPTRWGEGLSSANTVSEGEEAMPAPTMRKPSGVWARPNSTVYQYSRARRCRASCAAAQARAAVGREVVGVEGLHQERDVAEHVVKDVRLLDVLDLLRLADPEAGGKAAVGEQLEEHEVRHEARHRHDLPARRGAKPLVHDPKLGDAGLADAEGLEPVEEGGEDAALKQGALASGQRAPGGVIGVGVVGELLVDEKVARVVAGGGGGRGVHGERSCPCCSRITPLPGRGCRRNFAGLLRGRTNRRTAYRRTQLVVATPA